MREEAGRALKGLLGRASNRMPNPFSSTQPSTDTDEGVPSQSVRWLPTGVMPSLLCNVQITRGVHSIEHTICSVTHG